MNISEYSQKAHTTAIYPNRGKNLAYAVLGLIEELMETEEKVKEGKDKKEIEKELGDILWYMNAVCFELGYSLEEVSREKPKEMSISEIIQVVAGKTKKHIRDDEGSLDTKKRASIIEALVSLNSYVKKTAKDNGSSIDSVCEKNIEKLFSRKERGVLKGSGDNR